MNKLGGATLKIGLRFPDFLIESNWDYELIGNISEIVRGGSPRPIEQFLTNEENGLNWLKIGDISQESKYILQTNEKVIRDALNHTREVYPGDLILSNSMSFGRPYILKIKTCIHDGWIAMRNISDKVVPEYLYYFVLSEQSQKYFKIYAAGAAVKNLNAEIVKALPILLPKISEQQKIADCLSSLDELISAEGEKLEALRAHKKGLMQQLFPAEGESVPRLRFGEFEKDPYWASDILGGENISIIVNEKNRLEKVKLEQYVSTENILQDFTGIVKASKLPSSGTFTCFRQGDILISNIRPYLKKIWQSDMEGSASNDIIILRSGPSITSSFLTAILQNDRFISFIMEGAQGVKMPRGDKSSIINYPVLYPSISEQNRITDCVSSISNLILSQSDKVEALKRHKKGLMQQLFPVMEMESD